MNLTRRNKIALIVTAGVLSICPALASCGPADSNVEVPAIVWQNGEPSGPYENDRAVKAVREGDALLSAANNARDYSDLDLAGAVTRSVLLHAALGMEADINHDRPWYVPGPRPMTVLSVKTNEKDSTDVDVRVCKAVDWALVPGKTTPRKPTLGYEAEYNVWVRPNHASVQNTMGSHTECDISEAAYGYFDPQPELDWNMTGKDVKYPLKN